MMTFILIVVGLWLFFAILSSLFEQEPVEKFDWVAWEQGIRDATVKRMAEEKAQNLRDILARARARREGRA